MRFAGVERTTVDIINPDQTFLDGELQFGVAAPPAPLFSMRRSPAYSQRQSICDILERMAITPRSPPGQFAPQQLDSLLAPMAAATLMDATVSPRPGSSFLALRDRVSGLTWDLGMSPSGFQAPAGHPQGAGGSQGPTRDPQPPVGDFHPGGGPQESDDVLVRPFLTERILLIFNNACGAADTPGLAGCRPSSLFDPIGRELSLQQQLADGTPIPSVTRCLRYLFEQSRQEKLVGRLQEPAGGHQEAAGEPQEAAGSPQDLGGSPLDLDGSSQDLGGSPQDLEGRPQTSATNDVKLADNPGEILGPIGNPQVPASPVFSEPLIPTIPDVMSDSPLDEIDDPIGEWNHFLDQ